MYKDVHVNLSIMLCDTIHYQVVGSLVVKALARQANFLVSIPPHGFNLCLYGVPCYGTAGMLLKWCKSILIHFLFYYRSSH